MTYKKLLESVSGLAGQISQLQLQIAKQLEPVVRHLIATKSRDAKTIEQTLDRLLDVACHDTGLTEFRRLCRYYWTIDPEATASYVLAYGEMWDDEYHRNA